jgi:hypothetical protein
LGTAQKPRTIERKSGPAPQIKPGSRKRDGAIFGATIQSAVFSSTASSVAQRESELAGQKELILPISLNKRLKEKARQEKAQDKAERRDRRKEEKNNRPAGAPGEDPDIAGIVPGPQPPLPEFM